MKILHCIDKKLFNDLYEYRKKRKQQRDAWSPSSNPRDLSDGLRMLDESIIDMNVETGKYSRILLFLTIILAILTLVLVFQTWFMLRRP